MRAKVLVPGLVLGPLLGLLGLVGAGPTLAAGAPIAGPADLEPLEPLRDRVAAFLRGREEADADVSVAVDRIDPRLRLARCPRSPELFVPTVGARGGIVTVGARCAGARPWTIYVRARVRRYAMAVSLARALPAGTRLEPRHLRVERREVAGLDTGWFASAAEVAGLETARALAAGTVLTPRLVEAAPVIARGQRVVVLARAGGLEVRSAGVALADAAPGQRVRVRNLRSRRVVDARAIGAGVVEVAL